MGKNKAAIELQQEIKGSCSSYLLVLVGGDGGEDGLREAEGLHPLPAGHRLVGGQFAAEVLPDDVDARLILVHGVEDDLQAEGVVSVLLQSGNDEHL